MEPVQPVRVEAREQSRIWVEFADGVSGELDLSDMTGDSGFAELRVPAFWQSVHITDYRAIAWNDEIELCPDSIYAELTGLTLREMYPTAAEQRSRV